MGEGLDGQGSQGKLMQEFSGAAQAAGEGNSGAVCEFCHEPIEPGSRGPRSTMHPPCRERFWAEARRLGAQALRRRLAGRAKRQPRKRRRRLTASERRQVVVLLALGMVTATQMAPPIPAGDEEKFWRAVCELIGERCGQTPAEVLHDIAARAERAGEGGAHA